MDPALGPLGLGLGSIVGPRAQPGTVGLHSFPPYTSNLIILWSCHHSGPILFPDILLVSIFQTGCIARYAPPAVLERRHWHICPPAPPRASELCSTIPRALPNHPTLELCSPPILPSIDPTSELCSPPILPTSELYRSLLPQSSAQNISSSTKIP